MRTYKILIYTALSWMLCGCDKDFLDKTPLDEVTESTAFGTYDNFTTYSWSLYEYFEGWPDDGSYEPEQTIEESYSDNLIWAKSGSENPYAYQTKSVPTSGGNWSFTYLRKVNLLLDNIDKSSMSDEEKNHWRSVGYFFRALRYFDLLADYGDVPWIDHVVGDDESSVLYGNRTSRDTVAANILSDLQYAESNIGNFDDGDNTINANVIRALISRFALFEGTWRKYHGLNNSDTYLQACVDASEKLIAAYPTIMSNYDDLFNSEDLVGQPGIILAKQFATGLETHSITRVVRTSAWYADLTKDAVNSYLCSDGKPIASSALYEGDGSIYQEFRHRDRRLYYTVLPPYKVTLTGAAGTSTTWAYTNNTADREYIDTMNKISTSTAKALPVSNYAGYLVAGTPHFRNYTNGQGFIVSGLGYYFYKYYNNQSINMALKTSTTDYPLFRIEETMLNYAEAKYELGTFDQSIADITINKLRARANVSRMVVADINASFDPNRDQTVDPVLWEIRRERRVELMGDGFRFRDLKRWKKGEYLNNIPLGAWVKNSDYGSKLTIYGGAAEGYVQLFSKPLGWLDKYYLEPIPTQEIALNPNLKQTEGW